MQHRSVASALTVAALVSTLVASAASAETRMAVAPAVLDIAGPLGGTGTFEINVNNDGDRPLAINAFISEHISADGLPSATEWSDVRLRKKVVQPGKVAVVKLAIDIPDDVAPGGHYAAVSIDATAQREDPDQPAGASGRIIVPVHIAVLGDEENPTPWGVPAFHRSALFLRTDGEYVAQTEISNSGGTHVALEGTVTVDAVAENGEHEQVLKSRLPKGRVLPERERPFMGMQTEALTPGQPYEATFSLAEPARRPDEDILSMAESIQFVAEPEVALQDLAICVATAGDFETAGELDTSVTLINDGTVGVIPGISFRLEDVNGEPVAIARQQRELHAWPGETVTVASTMFTPSTEGEYDFVAEIAVGTDQVLRTETPVRIGEDGDVPECEPPADSS